MQKIFNTQLTGLLQNIDEDRLEDAARLLSQALIGEGHVYIHGKDEMAAVTSEALYGKEKIDKISPLLTEGKVTELDFADRALLISRSTNDEEMMDLARHLSSQGILIVGITAYTEDSTARKWTDSVDVHIDFNLTNSLVPTDTGERVGYPASLLALHTYFYLHLLIVEFLSEYE
ncbi:DUF2529 family protein [Halalkalibacter krulwichiae]|uniref:DUF2529 domain-containing protein n=1 Tax=Halalkalibacter krulwichiae TaxID=199441 RepID=A0A1X9MH46_9BACI|nr:DUF2529 family protein [Halalkalibacter krulwichiae]ARK32789.1 hypothetical protein BkAM31D_24625 [Halalkalibacter krulwichiae]